MPWAYVAGANIVSGLIGADAAKSAANTQAQSAQQALDFQKQQFNTIQQQGAPGRAAGYNALNQLGGLGSGTYGMYDASGNPTGVTGTGTGYLTHQFNAEDLKSGLAPNYDFMLGQGQEATNRMANVGGGVIGGNALTGLDRYTQDYAGNAYQNAFTNYQNQRSNIYNTLAGIAGLGQNAYNTSANTGATAAGQVGNTIQNLGAAQAGGQVGVANALSGGIQNAGNSYMLSQLLGNKQNQVPAGYTDTGGFAGGGTGVVNVPGQGTMSIGDYFKPA
jgi:hypothetical protein